MLNAETARREPEILMECKVGGRGTCRDRMGSSPVQGVREGETLASAQCLLPTDRVRSRPSAC